MSPTQPRNKLLDSVIATDHQSTKTIAPKEHQTDHAMTEKEKIKVVCLKNLPIKNAWSEVKKDGV